MRIGRYAPGWDLRSEQDKNKPLGAEWTTDKLHPYVAAPAARFSSANRPLQKIPQYSLLVPPPPPHFVYV